MSETAITYHYSVTISPTSKAVRAIDPSDVPADLVWQGAMDLPDGVEFARRDGLTYYREAD